MPGLEALGHLLAVHGYTQAVLTRTEVGANDGMDGKKGLRLVLLCQSRKLLIFNGEISGAGNLRQSHSVKKP
jgi:hypothetical protein